MTNDLDRTSRSEGDRTRARAYQWDFWPSIVAYGLLLTAVLIWGHLDGQSPSRYLWALVPVVPTIWTVRAVMRHVTRIDDYQRLLLLKGLAAGFAVAMIASLTIGLLGIAGLRTPAAGWIIYSAGMLGWLIAGARARIT